MRSVYVSAALEFAIAIDPETGHRQWVGVIVAACAMRKWRVKKKAPQTHRGVSGRSHS